MKEKFDYIILPPDGLHMHVEDLLFKGQIWFQSIVKALSERINHDETFLVKYRTARQHKNFPYPGKKKIGYGSFLDYAHENSVIVGPLDGSACVEALMNDLKFFSYCEAPDPHPNKGFHSQIKKVLWAASTTEDLLTLIEQNRIYRDGYSKIDLLHQDGMYLYQIVEHILNEKVN